MAAQAGLSDISCMSSLANTEGTSEQQPVTLIPATRHVAPHSDEMGALLAADGANGCGWAEPEADAA